MRKILEKLMVLQVVDIKLQTLEEARGDLPQKVNELKSEIEGIRLLLDQLNIDKKEKETRKHQIEGEVELLNGKLKKYQDQLYQVKNNKEYDAMTLEIENCEKNIEEHEYEILELDEALTSLGEKITETTQKLEEQEAQFVDKQKNLEVMLEKTKEEEDVLLVEREELSKGISKPLLNTYDRIRVNRGGRALSYLEDGACRECSSRIPPQRGLEIRLMDTLYYCEVCGRIMVWDMEKNKKPEAEEQSVNN